MGERRATQHDVAVKAGVGRSTVSLALSGHPKISDATRQRILKAARSLNYTPDPMLSALATYRNSIGTSAYHGTLAWLVNVIDGCDWHYDSGPHYGEYFSGACERAASYGYQLEKYYLNKDGISPARLRSILLARGITGVLLCPQPYAEAEIDFAWEDFSAITFGYSLAKPRLHTVASAHLLNTRHVMHNLTARGYHRIGLVIDRTTDRRCGSNVFAGYLVEQQLDPMPGRIPAFLDFELGPDRGSDYGVNLRHYIEKFRLDALITSDFKILETLKKQGLSAPDDIGVAGLSLPSANTPMTGIVEHSAQIGAFAMDLLVGMIHRGERGVPVVPVRSHLEGVWHEGGTIRASTGADGAD